MPNRHTDLDLQKRLVDRSDMPIVFMTDTRDLPMAVPAMKIALPGYP
jgi:FixJ family two-component response regulator